MKKTVRIVLAILFVLGIMIASAPLNALAKSDKGPGGETPNPLIAGGTWTTGKGVDVTTQAGSAPNWIQLLANGVKVTEAGKICHPFRGGQFGWVGQIMQYQNGQWVKLETTNDWVPNKEGEFMSCAAAPAAGTYALFGYWKRPTGYAESKAPIVVDCDTITWDVTSDALTFNGTVTGVPDKTIIEISISMVFPFDILITDHSSSIIDSAGNFTISPDLTYGPSLLELIFSLPEYGCTYTKGWEF